MLQKKVGMILSSSGVDPSFVRGSPVKSTLTSGEPRINYYSTMYQPRTKTQLSCNVVTVLPQWKRKEYAPITYFKENG